MPELTGLSYLYNLQLTAGVSLYLVCIVKVHNISTYYVVRLEQALAFRQFSAGVDEEETWIQEKEHLLSASDYGNLLSVVQVSLYAITLSF